MWHAREVKKSAGRRVNEMDKSTVRIRAMNNGL
jgi:hypothetical protein